MPRPHGRHLHARGEVFLEVVAVTGILEDGHHSISEAAGVVGDCDVTLAGLYLHAAAGTNGKERGPLSSSSLQQSSQCLHVSLHACAWLVATQAAAGPDQLAGASQSDPFTQIHLDRLSMGRAHPRQYASWSGQVLGLPVGIARHLRRIGDSRKCRLLLFGTAVSTPLHISAVAFGAQSRLIQVGAHTHISRAHLIQPRAGCFSSLLGLPLLLLAICALVQARDVPAYPVSRHKTRRRNAVEVCPDVDSISQEWYGSRVGSWALHMADHHILTLDRSCPVSPEFAANHRHCLRIQAARYSVSLDNSMTSSELPGCILMYAGEHAVWLAHLLLVGMQPGHPLYDGEPSTPP